MNALNAIGNGFVIRQNRCSLSNLIYTRRKLGLQHHDHHTTITHTFSLDISMVKHILDPFLVRSIQVGGLDGTQHVKGRYALRKNPINRAQTFHLNLKSALFIK